MIASLTLVDKLQSRQAKVGIIGLGYVGLPLAVAFAEAGFSVLGIDSDEARVISLNAGRSHIPDISWERLAALAPSGDRLASAVSAGSGGSAQQHQDEWSKPHAGGLFATTDYQVLSEVDVAIICVPTPLSKTKDPDLSFILAATEEIVRHLHPGMLVVLESSSCQGSKVPMG